MHEHATQPDPERYDVWVDPDGHERRHVIATVALMLGLDPLAAEKLLDSGSPVRRRVRRAEVRYLRARFADWGLTIRVEPEPTGLPDARPLAAPDALIRIATALRLPQAERWAKRATSQAVAGLVIGGSAWLIAQVTFLPMFDSAGLVVLLVASCSTGLFWGPSRPVLSPRALAGVVAVFAVLLAALLRGTPQVMDWLDRGRASDLTDVAGGLLFIMLCAALGAPLTASVVSRAPTRKSHG